MKIDVDRQWYAPVREPDLAGLQKNHNDKPNGTGSAPSDPPATTAVDKTSATSEGQDDAPKTPGQSLMDRILQSGFQKFVADIEAEKIAKLREKLLNAMGLNEEMLANMSPDQRKIIEDLIAEEIKHRMEAAQKMNGHEPHPVGAVPSSGISDIDTASDGVTAVKPGMNTGLGVLLALQEVEAEGSQSESATERREPGKIDPAVI